MERKVEWKYDDGTQKGEVQLWVKSYSRQISKERNHCVLLAHGQTLWKGWENDTKDIAGKRVKKRLCASVCVLFTLLCKSKQGHSCPTSCCESQIFCGFARNVHYLLEWWWGTKRKLVSIFQDCVFPFNIQNRWRSGAGADGGANFNFPACHTLLLLLHRDGKLKITCHAQESLLQGRKLWKITILIKYPCSTLDIGPHHSMLA